ncbi:MAG: hypothetical protein K2M95_07425, partial [Clostridiales bacterium]|nr:hypothetical protein [Clostridiales bacterium]
DFDSHPAYSKLFLETGGETSYMWARRRGSGITLVFTAHGDEQARYTANKKAYCERGTPVDFGQNTDPALCGVFDITLAPKQEKTYTFCVLVTENAEQAAHIAALAATPECRLQNKGSAAALSSAVPPLATETAAKLLRGELSALPDCPELPAVVSAEDALSADTLERRLAAYRYLCEAGLSFRLVFVCRADTSEERGRVFAIEEAIERSGILRFGIKADVLRADRETYARMKKLSTAVLPPPTRIAQYTAEKNAYATPESSSVSYTRPMGLGGFCGDAYSLDLTDERPPKPWCNILSSGTLGTVMTESGGGFTFTDNARERKLTRWHNDPAEAHASEFAAICENETAWSIARFPLCAPAKYRAEHGFGYTTYVCAYNGITASQTCFLTAHDGTDAKVVRVTLKNETDDARSLRVLFAAEFVLGDFARTTRHSLQIAECKNGVRLTCDKSGMECYLHASLPCEAVGACVEGAKESKTLILQTPHRSNT